MTDQGEGDERFHSHRIPLQDATRTNSEIMIKLYNRAAILLLPNTIALNIAVHNMCMITSGGLGPHPGPCSLTGPPKCTCKRDSEGFYMSHVSNHESTFQAFLQMLQRV